MTTPAPAPNPIELALRIVPRARQDAIHGTANGEIKVRLRAPPVDGKANTALLRLLADILDLPLSRIELISGEKARSKRVRIHGLTLAEIHARLGLAE